MGLYISTLFANAFYHDLVMYCLYICMHASNRCLHTPTSDSLHKLGICFKSHFQKWEEIRLTFNKLKVYQVTPSQSHFIVNKEKKE